MKKPKTEPNLKKYLDNLNSMVASFPTTEEAVDAIIGEFTPQQLQVLDDTKNKRIIKFRDVLLTKYQDQVPVNVVEKIKQFISFEIHEHAHVFNLENKLVARVFFERICECCFSKPTK